jgi:hypothetical protein
MKKQQQMSVSSSAPRQVVLPPHPIAIPLNSAIEIKWGSPKPPQAPMLQVHFNSDVEAKAFQAEASKTIASADPKSAIVTRAEKNRHVVRISDKQFQQLKGLEGVAAVLTNKMPEFTAAGTKPKKK